VVLSGRVRVAEEPSEADATVSLSFSLLVAEAVPLLDGEELDHHDLVGVGVSSFLGFVSEYA